jgi:hypothetical protein
MKVTATFSDGTTISRNTEKNYTHAYTVTNQWQTFTGFASSEMLAKRAAASDVRNKQILKLEVVAVNK